MKALVVRTPFADYAKGQQITEPKAIEEVMAGHNAHHVLPISLPDDPNAYGEHTERTEIHTASENDAS